MLYIYLSLASSNLTTGRLCSCETALDLCTQTYYMQACLSPITLVYDLDKHHLKADASPKIQFRPNICLKWPEEGQCPSTFASIPPCPKISTTKNGPPQFSPYPI